jgi:hypothetical protein
MAAYSLRDQAQIDQYRTKKRQSSWVTYDPPADPDPRRQDAAKIVVPADRPSLPTQVRLPIPPWAGSSLMVTWDAWWGSEFRHENTGIGNYKAFQLSSDDRIWTEVRSRFQQAEGSPAVANVDVRFYGGESTGPNVTDNVPLSPQVGTFAIQPETWTRYWAFFKPAGEWYEFSLWMADENLDAVLLIDRLQLKPNPDSSRRDWEKFWLEYNTSANTIPEGRGPLVAYARNVVMLRNVPDPTNLLQRPQR